MLIETNIHRLEMAGDIYNVINKDTNKVEAQIQYDINQGYYDLVEEIDFINIEQLISIGTAINMLNNARRITGGVE